MSKYTVVKAEYVDSYRLRITFQDGKVNIVDFQPFLQKKPHPQWNRYCDIELFKQFKIEDGNIVWGDNWDLIFYPLNLYYNNLFKNYEKSYLRN